MSLPLVTKYILFPPCCFLAVAVLRQDLSPYIAADNEKCSKPSGEDLKHSSTAPSDSCSPCAKHFLTATNLDCILILHENAPKRNRKFCEFIYKYQKIRSRPYDSRRMPRTPPNTPCTPCKTPCHCEASAHTGCGERTERCRWQRKRSERVAAVKILSVRRKAAQKFWAPQQEHPPPPSSRPSCLKGGQ